MSKGTESHTSRSTEICLEGINAPWGEVLHLAVRSSYPKGHKTLGSCLQGFYYIASGRVRLSYLNEDGEEYGKLRGCPACFLILKGVVISSHETNRFS